MVSVSTTKTNFTESIKLAVAKKIFPQFNIVQKLGRYEADFFGMTFESRGLTTLCITIVEKLFSIAEAQKERAQKERQVEDNPE